MKTARKNMVILVKVNGILQPKRGKTFNKFKAYHPSKKPVSLAKVTASVELLPEVDWEERY